MWCKDHKNECYYSRQIKPCDDEITNPSPYGMSPPAPLLDVKLEIDHFFVYPGNKITINPNCHIECMALPRFRGVSIEPAPIFNWYVNSTKLDSENFSETKETDENGQITYKSLLRFKKDFKKYGHMLICDVTHIYTLKHIYATVDFHFQCKSTYFSSSLILRIQTNSISANTSSIEDGYVVEVKSNCSESCGENVEYLKKMTCKSSCFPKFNNPDCCKIEIDTEKCNTNKTICNGEYGEWTSTHECTKSCVKNINEKSTKIRSRQVYRSVERQWGKT